MRSSGFFVVLAAVACTNSPAATDAGFDAQADGPTADAATDQELHDGGSSPTPWAKRFGDANASQQGNAIAVAPTGDVLVTGELSGAADFGGGTIVGGAGNLSNMFVAGFGADGTYRWAKVFGATVNGPGNGTSGYGIVADTAGNANVVGYATGIIDFGGGKVGFENDAGITYSYFTLLKYSLQGAYVSSAVQVSDQIIPFDFERIATDSTGAFVATGPILGHTVNFGAGDTTGSGEFLVKVDSNYTQSWIKIIGCTATGCAIPAVATSPSNDVIALASVPATNPVDFGAGNIAGGIVLVRYSAAGALLSAIGIGDAKHVSARGLAVDSAGDTIVVGGFDSATDFGSGSISPVSADDIFVMKRDASNKLVWIKTFGQPLGQGGFAVAVDRNDDVIVTGIVDGTLDFGGTSVSSTGSDDMYLVRLKGTDGSGTKSGHFGGTQGTVSPRAIAVGLDGALVATGNFSGTVDFGEGPLTSTAVTQGVSQDIFVASFGAW